MIESDRCLWLDRWGITLSPGMYWLEMDESMLLPMSTLVEIKITEVSGNVIRVRR